LCVTHSRAIFHSLEVPGVSESGSGRDARGVLRSGSCREADRQTGGGRVSFTIKEVGWQCQTGVRQVSDRCQTGWWW
jgi:hypothetical protein